MELPTDGAAEPPFYAWFDAAALVVKKLFYAAIIGCHSAAFDSGLYHGQGKACVVRPVLSVSKGAERLVSR